MTPITDFLADITAASRDSRSIIEAKGRLQRAPDYTKPRISSSRPRSDKGVSFHFAHKTISKRNDISESASDATSAASHQLYIERLEAVSVSQEDLKGHALEAGILSGFPSLKNPSFKYPDLIIEDGRESFGTLGSNKASRADFWRLVEISEGRTARIQNRIIAELPHETTQSERVQIAMNFCRSLHQEGLPFWATIHAPTKANDSRNYHLHIAYSDRPAAINDAREWDFSIQKETIKPNRVRVLGRPYKQNKSEAARHRTWVKKLRHDFARSNNEILSRSGYEKRLDPRSYKESGIAKAPTEHLGFKSNAAEKFGLETTRGTRNSRKEYSWRLTQASARWTEMIGEHDASLLFQDFSQDSAGWQREKELKKKLAKGKTIAINSARYAILSEAVSQRVASRKRFLSSERKRVASNEKRRSHPDSQQTLTLIDLESEVIETRLPQLLEISELMMKKSAELSSIENDIWESLNPVKTPQIDPTSENPFGPAPTYPIDDIFGQDDPFDVETVDISAPIDTLFGTQPTAEEPLDISRPSNADQVTPSRINPTIPGTLLIPDLDSRKDLAELNERLLRMTNREVRVRAITTRDASEFLEGGEEKYQARRGWIVLRSEAEKRGIDLETGKQNLSVATDPVRAKLHQDEGNETVLEIRQEVIRVMSR